MISYNALIIWVPLIVFLLFVFNRWNEKRLIRQVEKILSPVKKDVLFETPKLHLQHLNKTPIEPKSNMHQTPSANQLGTDQSRPPSVLDKTFAKDREIFNHFESNKTTSLTKPSVSQQQIKQEDSKIVKSVDHKITKNIPENLVSTRREIDVAFDEMLENMAKRASMRKK